MGPGEPPLLPDYEPLVAPAGHVLVSNFIFGPTKVMFDPRPSSYLHRQANVPDNLKRLVTGTDGKLPLALYDADMAPRIDAEETDYGVRIFSLREVNGRTFFARDRLRLSQQGDDPGPMSGDGYNLYWHVPIDDTHHWRYDFVFRRSAPMEPRDIERDREILDELGPDYRPNRNKANRLSDREAMKTWSFWAWGGSSTCMTSPSFSKAAAKSSTAAKNS